MFEIGYSLLSKGVDKFLFSGDSKFTGTSVS